MRKMRQTDSRSNKTKKKLDFNVEHAREMNEKTISYYRKIYSSQILKNSFK